MRRRTCLTAVIAVFSALTFVLIAPSCAHADSPKNLKVGVYESPPFAFKDDLGNWHGISVDLWSAVAGENGFLFEYVEVPEKDAVGRLAEGDLDVIAAGLPIRAETEKLVDFSQPFYASDWAIAVMKKPAATLFGSLTKIFLSWQLWAVVAGLVAVLLLVGLIIWFFEGRENKEDFGSNPAQSVMYGLYWAVAMMTGAGEKAPRTVSGRIIAMLWIFAGLFVTGAFTASITTVLSVDHLTGKITGEHDLPNAHVAVMKGSCEEILRGLNARYTVCADAKECYMMLKSGEVDAIVGGEPRMEYYASRALKGKLDIIPMNYEEVFYAFGLKPVNRISEKVNRSILKITSSHAWGETLRKYTED